MNASALVRPALISVAIGIVANVVVAFGCALWRQPRGQAFMQPAQSGWIRPVPRDWPPVGAFTSGSGVGWSYWAGSAFVHDSVAGTESDYTLVVHCHGWPMRSMEYRLESTVVVNTKTFPLRTTGSSTKRVYTFSVPPRACRALGVGDAAVLPMRPRAPETLGNAAVFSAVAMFGWWGWRALVRARRLRRNLCVACGYPAGPQPSCSECGEPLPSGPR